jgi:hypothetical protein
MVMTKLCGRVIFALLAACLVSCPLPAGPEWTRIIDPKSTGEGAGGSIADYNLQAYVQIPVRGAVPVKTIDSRADMKITVDWKVGDNPPAGDFTEFIEGAEYTAVITLEAKEGYSFAPIPFKYYPEEAVDEQPDENLDVKRRALSPISYKKTAEPNSLNGEGLNLALRIPAPVGGASPVTSFYAGDYGGAVTWEAAGGTPLTGTFQPGTAYTAQVTLYAAAGYTLRGGGGGVTLPSPIRKAGT